LSSTQGILCQAELIEIRPPLVLVSPETKMPAEKSWNSSTLVVPERRPARACPEVRASPKPQKKPAKSKISSKLLASTSGTRAAGQKVAADAILVRSLINRGTQRVIQVCTAKEDPSFSGKNDSRRFLNATPMHSMSIAVTEISSCSARLLSSLCHTWVNLAFLSPLILEWCHVNGHPSLTCVQKDQEQNTEEKGSAMSSFQRSEESSTSQASPTSCLTNDRENTSSTSNNATANEADQESSADSPPRAVVHGSPNSDSLEKFSASPPKASEPSSGSSSSTILDPSLISQEQQQRPNRNEVLEQSAVSINPTACIQAIADERNLQGSTFTFEVSQDARWLTYRNVFCIPSADIDCLKACFPWD
jgi:hypothetical protein